MIQRKTISRANPERTQEVNWLFGKHGALFCAATEGNIDLLRELVADGAEVNRPSPNGYVPLHRAAQSGHKLIVEFLLQAGALPEPRSRKGETPADLAAAAGHNDIAALLQKAERERLGTPAMPTRSR